MFLGEARITSKEYFSVKFSSAAASTPRNMASSSDKPFCFASIMALVAALEDISIRETPEAVIMLVRRGPAKEASFAAPPPMAACAAKSAVLMVVSYIKRSTGSSMPSDTAVRAAPAQDVGRLYHAVSSTSPVTIWEPMLPTIPVTPPTRLAGTEATEAMMGKRSANSAASCMALAYSLCFSVGISSSMYRSAVSVSPVLTR